MKILEMPINYKARNKELLDSFVEYCNENPDQRFWQALRNWSGIPYILAAEHRPGHYAAAVLGIEDTFYKEHLDRFPLKRKGQQ